jgi:mannose-6-phosphate isomerase-like protein (cupin superfamily)
MKASLSIFITGVAAGVALTGALSTGVPALANTTADLPHVAQEKAEANVKVVLENDRVRVRDVTFPPGVTGMHTHKLPHVGVVIDGGTLVFRYPDGKTETAKLDRGGAGFREANVTHEPTNPGKAPVRVIEVELK